MKLGRSTQKFAETPVYTYNFLTATWGLLPNVLGSFFVYDRFISDRAFGQKKRLFQTPVTMKLPMLPTSKTVIRIGDSPTVFLIESENEDIQLASAFANIYSLRALTWQAVISKKTGGAWASGAPKKDTYAEVDRVWADYDRYSASRNTESPGVFFTVDTVILPRGTVVDSDCRIAIDGQVFEVNEVATLLNSLYCRVQRVGVASP